MTLNYYKLAKPPKVHNPNYGISHNIQIPARIGIVGSSGSGKTNILLDLLHRFSTPKGTFKGLLIYLRSRHEPLYDYLAEKVPETQFIEVQSDTDILPVDDVDDTTLVVFDDLILADPKTQKKIGEYFIRGRKRGLSCVYISQNYFGIPKIIRQQLSYIILKKINSSKDLNLILNEFPIDMDIKELKTIYSTCNKGIESSLMIDLNKGDLYKNFKLINKEDFK
jgi:ABC-type dipeptide/oligopeptide/nickel transport system ATPase component